MTPFHAWLLYGVLAVKWWFVDDVVDLVRGRVGQFPFPWPQGRELAAAVAGKAVFLGWAVVVPLVVFRSGRVAPLFLLGALTLGVVLSVVFQQSNRSRLGWEPPPFARMTSHRDRSPLER